MALSKIEDTEKMFEDGKTDVERLDVEKQKNLAENSELNQKLETGEKSEAEMSRQVEGMKSQRDDLTLSEQHKLHQDETLAQQIKRLDDKVTELESALESLQGEKTETELKFEQKDDQLRAEMLDLKDRFSEFERIVAQREIDFSSPQEKHETGQTKAAAQVVALLLQVNSLHKELDSIQTQKNEIVLQFEKDKQEFLDDLTQLATDKIELIVKTTYLQTMLDEVYNKLSEEHQQLKDKWQEDKISIESKDKTIADLEQLSEELKRDLEAKQNEISSWEEKSREKFENLDTEARKEQLEKGRLIEAVSRLQKKIEELMQIVEEQNEDILDQGAKKIAAIRQLSATVEHYRSQYYDLKIIFQRWFGKMNGGKMSDHLCM